LGPKGASGALVKQARHDAGRAPDAGTAEAALHAAARDQRITLTPNATAMDHAATGAKHLDGYMESLRKSGQLSVFNGRYKRERAAATASGCNFMTYSAALARLRRVLIPIMTSGVQQGVGTLFEQIFQAK
jgi:hypothetical protein